MYLIILQSAVTLAGNPGKEFNFGINPQIVGKGRVYVSNNKLYLLVVVTPDQANAANFFNSFRLIAWRRIQNQ